MSGNENLDMFGVAAGTVVGADQFFRYLEASNEGKEDHAKKHATYAAIGAAVAIGALEALRRDEKKRTGEPVAVPHANGDPNRFNIPNPREKDKPGHTRRMAEEMAGLYALGQEVMGHKKHHVVHTVAEALGALAAYKDVKDHSTHGGME